MSSFGIYSIVVLFMYTGVTKLLHLDAFQWSLSKSPLIPNSLVPPVSFMIPIIEICLALLLCIRKYFKTALVFALTLMGLFTIYTVFIYFFSPDVPCTCGGIIEALSWPQQLIINSILTILLFMALRLRIAKAFIIVFIFVSTNSYSQNATLTIVIKDSLRKEAIIYPSFLGIVTKAKIKVSLMGNEGGILTVSLKRTDTITGQITSSGYEPATIVVTTLLPNPYVVYLAPLNNVMKNIEIGVDKVRVQPGKVSMRFDKYIVREMESLNETIGRLPGILSKGKSDFYGVGGKKLIVYLDGRQLSDAELQALPSLTVAKADLVNFPSPIDADERSAVLYLTSSEKAYQYSYTELSGNYGVGIQGPGAALRRVTKKGSWSSSLLLNIYKYKYQPAYNVSTNDLSFYQSDVITSKSQSAIGNFSVTHENLRGSLWTTGIIINNFNDKSVGNSFLDKQGTRTSLISNSSNNSFDGTVFSSYRMKSKKGSSWVFSAIFTRGLIRQKYFFEETNQSFQWAGSDFKNNKWFSSLTAKRIMKTKVVKGYEIKNQFIGGVNIRDGNIFQTNISGKKDGSGITSKVSYHSEVVEKGLYGGFQNEIGKRIWKIETGAILNYSFNNNSNIVYQPFYLFPQITGSYKFKKSKSLSLSISYPVRRPDVSFLVSDTSFVSNWLKKTGNNKLETEKNLSASLLFTSSSAKLFFQAEGRQQFFDKGIVSAFVPLQSGTEYSLVYLNQNYRLSKVSLFATYSFDVLVSMNLSVIYRNMNFQQNFYAGFNRRSWVNSDATLSYTKGKGSFSVIVNGDFFDFIFLKKSRLTPSLSFSGYYQLNRKFILYANVNDVFNSKGDIDITRAFHLTQQNNIPLRQISLSLSWIIGQSFNVKSAGDGKPIADDVKNKVVQ